VLPYTPSHTGRRSRVGYLGLDGVDFAALWPVFGGLVASIALGLDFFVGGGWPRGGWFLKTLCAAAPVALGFGYLRFLVVGRPPHFRRDLAHAALRVRIDFSDPPFAACPWVPRIGPELGDAEEAAVAAEAGHPARRGRR